MLKSLKLENDLILAPMMDVTTPSYVLLRKYYGGVGLFSMPMVFINQIVLAPKTIRPIAEFVEKNKPSSLQICGSGRSIETIKQAVDILNSYSFDVLDINCGCPAKHTCRSGGGASLLQSHRFKELECLINTSISSSNKPVSVKIRTGWDSTSGLKGIVELIENEGAAFLTVHGRLAKQNYSGIVDLKTIQQVKKWVNIPVVGNGDIYSYKSYIKMKKITSVDAVMIGRASMSDPSIFSEIATECNKHNTEQFKESILKNDTLIEFTSEYKSKYQKINNYEDIKSSLMKLLEIIENLGKYWNNDRFKFKELRNQAIWMLKGTYNGRNIREKIGKMKKLDILIDYINRSEFENDVRILE